MHDNGGWKKGGVEIARPREPVIVMSTHQCVLPCVQVSSTRRKGPGSTQVPVASAVPGQPRVGSTSALHTTYDQLCIYLMTSIMIQYMIYTLSYSPQYGSPDLCVYGKKLHSYMSRQQKAATACIACTTHITAVYMYWQEEALKRQSV